MKALLDSSVLVAAMQESHPAHGRSLPWLKRARGADVDLHVASHSVAETFAVLTTLPVKPRIAPGMAWRMLKENVLARATLVALSSSEHVQVVKQAAELGLAGGVVYDALIAAAARKAAVRRLVTLNPDDFRRCWPDAGDVVTTP